MLFLKDNETIKVTTSWVGRTTAKVNFRLEGGSVVKVVAIGSIRTRVGIFRIHVMLGGLGHPPIIPNLFSIWRQGYQLASKTSVSVSSLFD